MPRLFTSTSTLGKRLIVSFAASAVERSRASASSLADGTPSRMAAIASATRASLRPLMITRAPSAASSLAMAKPMPAVEPLTSASLSLSERVTCCSFFRPRGSPLRGVALGPGNEPRHAYFNLVAGLDQPTQRRRPLDIVVAHLDRQPGRNLQVLL